MLRACVLLLRLSSASSRQASAPRLVRQLRQLRRANRRATQQLRQRRRLDSDAHTSASSTTATDATTSSAAAARRAMRRCERATRRVVPHNAALASAMAMMLHTRRDARAELEFTRQLLHSRLLSLASPVGPWDPYDVRPQVFAFDTRVALPVFTSLAYVRRFCQRHGFVVRDPAGALWADGTSASSWQRDAAPLAVTAPAQSSADDTASSNSSSRRSSRDEHTHDKTSHADGRDDAYSDNNALSADALFADLDTDVTSSQQQQQQQHEQDKQQQQKQQQQQLHTRKRRATTRARRRRRQQQQQLQQQRARVAAAAARDARQRRKAAARERAAFVQSVATVSPLQTRRVTPLALFGPLQRPFFVGYFADVDTLLHNIALVPPHVDLVVNPASPLELVLAREATNALLQRDQVLHTAYRNVERELQHEFASFFARYCPEVTRACSACVPLPLALLTRNNSNSNNNTNNNSNSDSGASQPTWPEEDTAEARVLREAAFANEADYEIVILVDSSAMQTTYAKMHLAKQRGVLTGHSKLDVLPTQLAAPHVQEAARPFYRAQTHATTTASTSSSPPLREGSVMRFVARTPLLDVRRSADSYYHEVEHAYTEPHALCTTTATLTPLSRE